MTDSPESPAAEKLTELPSSKDRLKLYLGIAVKAMRECGAATAVLEYAGGNDEGDVENITLYGADGQQLDHTALNKMVEIPDWKQNYAQGKWTVEFGHREVSLDNLLSYEVYDMALDVYDLCDFESGKGGYGTLTISTEGSGELKLEHKDWGDKVKSSDSMAL
ncbi:MAG: hypothetical protein KGL39_21595 [Patescibacteria group bacterium]|nr:hypothetical protein [Patescibacteria group bacterium]